MNKQLADILSGIFALKTSEIRPELKKADVGTWDSLKQMDLVLSLEKEYGVTLEITDIVRMVSVAEIEGVLRNKGVNLAD